VVKQPEWDNDNLILHFDWIDVLRTHPANDIGKAQQTDNALVCFENVKVIKSQWHDQSKAVENAYKKREITGDTSVVLDIDVNEIEINDIDILDALNNIDIVSLDIETTGEKYICKIFGDGHRDEYYKLIRIIEFEYSGVSVCFNEFTGNAWFDDEFVWDGSKWVRD
jgi:hypothetical protein